MNFIIFNPDEMRAESVGCYGHPVVQTPNIDRLAGQGVRFDRAYCQHTVCTPSRCSFTTGWYPHVRGHRTLWHLLQPDEPNLYKYLKQAGYHVFWDGGHNDLLAADSFPDSVDTLQSSNGPGGQSVTNPFDRDDPRYYSFLYDPGETTYEQLPDLAKVRAAIEFVKSRKPGDKPFVIHLPLGFPHCPYWAPQPYHDRYDPETLPPLRPQDRPGRPDYYDLIRRRRRLDECDDALFRKINAVYLGMITVTDRMLGELMDALDQTGAADETTLMFFADHGDYAGDYGLVEKWTSGLEDVLTRVPLIIRAPGNTPGHVVAEQVELFDIMATAMDLAGVKAQHTHFARSLVPQLQGASGDPDRAVFAEGGYDTHEPVCFEGNPETAQTTHRDGEGQIYWPKCMQQQDQPESIRRCTMIRTLAHKLIYRPGGQSELYDLLADPREMTNLYGSSEYAQIQNDLSMRMLDWYVHTADVVPHDLDDRGISEGLKRMP